MHPAGSAARIETRGGEGGQGQRGVMIHCEWFRVVVYVGNKYNSAVLVLDTPEPFVDSKQVFQ